MGELDATKLVFIDESGFTTSLTRFYGWAPVGQKPIIISPRWGKRVTIVGAIAVDGPRAMHQVEGRFDGPAFVKYLDEVLGPTLREGDIVVMDGPSLHRVAGVEEALAKRGAKPLYLPPYSPELNPIEMCWSLMKSWIRRWTPRALERLTATIEKAWARLTQEHCAAWIRHSGYAVGST